MYKFKWVNLDKCSKHFFLKKSELFLYSKANFHDKTIKLLRFFYIPNTISMIDIEVIGIKVT